MSAHGVQTALERILALANNPGWTSERRWQIAQLAQDALESMKYYKQLDSRICELDDEVAPGNTDGD